MLVVTGVLVVLAGVVVFAVVGADTRAREAVCDEELRILRTAVQSYRADTGYWPANELILVPEHLGTMSSRWDYVDPGDLLIGTPTYEPTPECEF